MWIVSDKTLENSRWMDVWREEEEEEREKMVLDTWSPGGGAAWQQAGMDSEEDQVCVCICVCVCIGGIAITVFPFCSDSFTRLISSSSVPASERSSAACVSATERREITSRRWRDFSSSHHHHVIFLKGFICNILHMNISKIEYVLCEFILEK